VTNEARALAGKKGQTKKTRQGSIFRAMEKKDYRRTVRDEKKKRGKLGEGTGPAIPRRSRHTAK